uniref:Uncharacterized protein n=1 Tax=Tanacetum cinerariifolium TaxID=118510 RepID=A0A6L2NXF5_TANCI|nr:hypothetical protein [Tanacetum cinerariifolium]
MDTGCRLFLVAGLLFLQYLGKASSIPNVLSWIDSISSDGFLPFILLVVVIMVTVNIVAVVLEIVVIVIVVVVIVVTGGYEAVTFPLILMGNPPMKTSTSFSEFRTMFGHKSANSWNLLLSLFNSVQVILLACSIPIGWAYAFHQDKASLVRVPVANVTLSSSAHLLRENTDSFPLFATGVSLDLRFLLGLLVFAMVVASASRAATIPSEINFEEEDGGWICFLGGDNSSGTKKYEGSNSSDGGNTGDVVKITSGVIGSGDGIVVINKCLSGKSTGYDSLRLSQAQILWRMYHKKNVYFAYLLFTKVIIHFFITKDPSIPMRNKVNWHYVRDDQMFTTIKLVSRHQNTQQFGASLPIELTNEDIRNSITYKEYYDVASGAAPPKTKASVRKTQHSSDTTITPPTAAGTRLWTLAKGKQPAKYSKAKGLYILSKVAMTKAEQIKLATKKSLQQTHISQASKSGTDKETGILPGVRDFSIHKEEAKDEESFDPIVQTPKNSDDEGNDDDSLGMNVGGEEGQDAEDDDEELYKDVNINLDDPSYTSSKKETSRGFTYKTLKICYCFCIFIQRRVEDLQLGVESYQKKLNLTKSDTYHFDLKRKEAYTAYSNPRGFIYQNKDKQNRLMRIDELHKFSDGTLNDVRTALDDRLKGNRRSICLRLSREEVTRKEQQNRSIAAIWPEKVVTPLIEPAIKGFAAAPVVLKLERLRVDKTRYE